MKRKKTKTILLTLTCIFTVTGVVLHILSPYLYPVLSWNIRYITVPAIISDSIAIASIALYILHPLKQIK